MPEAVVGKLYALCSAAGEYGALLPVGFARGLTFNACELLTSCAIIAEQRADPAKAVAHTCLKVTRPAGVAAVAGAANATPLQVKSNRAVSMSEQALVMMYFLTNVLLLVSKNR